jgi:hypothetical protein
MKKNTLSMMVAGALMLSMAIACDNDRAGDIRDRNDNDNDNVSTTGSYDGATDGTTSSMGTNPTNSTGSTGKAMDNESTAGRPDTTRHHNNNTEGMTTGRTTH